MSKTRAVGSWVVWCLVAGGSPALVAAHPLPSPSGEQVVRVHAAAKAAAANSAPHLLSTDWRGTLEPRGDGGRAIVEVVAREPIGTFRDDREIVIDSSRDGPARTVSAVLSTLALIAFFFLRRIR